MRRIAVLLIMGGAIAAIAATAIPTKSHARGLTTRDDFPLFIDEPGGSATVFAFEFAGEDGPRLDSTLAVFSRPTRPADLLPRSVLFVASLPTFVPAFAPVPQRGRLLLARGDARLYAYPTRRGNVCYFLEPAGIGSCALALVDGAMPHVEAGSDGVRGVVWGLVDDSAVAVDVRAGHRVIRAALGENAFYLRLPQRVVAPTSLTVRERTGVRHLFVFQRCRFDQVRRRLPYGPLGAPGVC
jgi:hypothetical protein